MDFVIVFAVAIAASNLVIANVIASAGGAPVSVPVTPSSSER